MAGGIGRIRRNRNFVGQAVLTVLALALGSWTPNAGAQSYAFERAWPMSSYLFKEPHGVAVDSSGNVYVADSYNQQIQKLDAFGNVITKWGGSAQFNIAFGIAVDGSGNVYVADPGYARIQKFTSTGVFITKWGTQGNGDGQFANILGVAVDASGNVYAVESGNHRVQKFTSNGVFITKWGTEGNGDGQFEQPCGVAVDASGNVYVADTWNHRIQKFTSSGDFIAKWGTYGSGDGQFNYPHGVEVDASGYMYVADSGNNRIQVLSPSGDVVATWGSAGNRNGQFQNPTGVAVDASGNAYIADTYNSCIQKFSTSGAFLAKWGFLGGEDGEFYYPHGMAVDRSGNLYTADAYNFRIQKFTAAGDFLTAWGNQGNGDGQFALPTGVAADPSNNVYVVDPFNFRVQKFSSTGTFISKWGEWGSDNGQFNMPQGLAVDDSENVYVADTDNHRIQKFSSSGAFLTAWGSQGSSDGQFDSPAAVATDASGNVYVADSNNGRIQKFSSDGIFIAKWGSPGSGDGQFDWPQAITVDASGYVFVADTNSHRIQRFTPSGGFMMKWGIFGTDYGQMNTPRGLAVGLTGDVYVADSSNHRIQQFSGYLSAPLILSPNGGIDYVTGNSAAVRLTGRCEWITPAIHVNGSATGVTYTPGSSFWSYAGGPLVPGANVFTVTAFNGSADSIADTLTVTLDTNPPSVTMTSVLSNPTNLSPIPVTVLFSEPVTGFDAGDIVPGNATVANFTGTGADYTFDLVPSGQGLVTADIAAGIAQDAVGNGNTSANSLSYTYDLVAPTVVIDSAAPDPTNLSPVPVTVTFSEPVTGFDAGDIALGNATIVNFAGTGTNYTFDLIPSGEGIVTAGIAGAVARDAAGNGNTAAAQFERRFDSVGPAVTLESASSGAVNAAVVVTVALTEESTDFDASDVTATNATVSDFTGSATSYSFTLVPVAQGAFSAVVNAGAIRDATGNGNTVSNTLNFAYDTEAPNAVLESTVADPTNADTIAVTVSFSEPVFGFTAEDISVTNATLSGFAGSGAAYAFTLTPAGEGLVVASLAEGAAQDASANPSSTSTLTRTVDRTPPTIALGAPSVSATTSGPVTFTVTYTGATNITLAPAGVNLITTGNVTGAIGVSGSGATRTVAVSDIAGNGTLTVSIATDTASDDAGNLAPAAGPGATVEVLNVPADLNRDGLLNAGDVQLIINAVLRLPVQGNPDVNRDGRVDATDVQLVINAVLRRS